MNKYFYVIFLLSNMLIFAQNDFLPVEIKFNDETIKEGFVSFKTLNSIEKKILFQSLDKAQEFKINFTDIYSLVLSESEYYIYGNVKFDKRRLLSDSEIIKYDSNDELVNYEVKSDLLLKRVVEGEMELFVASVEDVNIYYLKKQNSNDFQYLEYYKVNTNGIIDLPKFRRQLSKELYIENKPINDYNNLAYNERDLGKVVLEYNKLKGNYIEIKNANKKGFNLSPVLGLKIINYNISSDYLYNGGFSGNKSVFFGGLEFDYLIPSKMSKFSIFSQLTYHQFSVEEESGFKTVNSGVTRINDGFNIDSGVVNLDFGTKYYFKDFFSNNGFFLNAKINYQVMTNKEFTYFNTVDSGSDTVVSVYNGRMKNNITFSIGVGYKIANKLTFNINYSASRDYTELGPFTSNVSDFSFGINYILFRKK